MELVCSRDLALWLGAIPADDVAAHKRMRDAGWLLLRDDDGAALFWPWLTMAPETTRRSS